MFFEYPVTKLITGTRRCIIFKNSARFWCAILMLHHHEVGFVHPSLLHCLNVKIKNLGFGQWLFLQVRPRGNPGACFLLFWTVVCTDLHLLREALMLLIHHLHAVGAQLFTTGVLASNHLQETVWTALNLLTCMVCLVPLKALRASEVMVACNTLLMIYTHRWMASGIVAWLVHLLTVVLFRLVISCKICNSLVILQDLWYISYSSVTCNTLC